MKSARMGNEDVLQKGLSVENGAAAGNLEIVISADSAQLEGAVTDNDQNQAPAGVQVRARRDPPTDYNRFPWHQASTDQNGRFIIKDIPPGKYKVIAKIPSSGGWRTVNQIRARASDARRARAPNRRHQTDCSQKRINKSDLKVYGFSRAAKKPPRQNVSYQGTASAVPSKPFCHHSSAFLRSFVSPHK